nr:MAG TPA: hypothetical protein [Caudoviricetes sp.]
MNDLKTQHFERFCCNVKSNYIQWCWYGRFFEI